MDTEKQEGPLADGAGDESLNTGSAGSPQASEGEHHAHRKGGIHNNALFAAGMGRAATAQVDPHSNSGLANTGTNISYEGPTAPGAGGSVGSGYSSGQSGADSSITSDSDYDEAGIGKALNNKEGSTDNANEGEDEISGQR